MFDKNFLVNKVVNALLKRNFEVLVTEGSFDIAAKKEKLILIKILLNVDGLNEDQALSLRAVAHFMSAFPFVISMQNNRNILEKNIVYSRFELPVVTPKLFEAIIDEEVEALQSAKGKHTIEINEQALREKRNESEFTLEQLANLVGISKKALYEIEKKRVNPTDETVRSLERVLSVKLRKTYEPKEPEEIILKPRGEFQEKVHKEFQRIGIKNSPVYSGPIELVGKEKFSLISSLSKNSEKLKHEAGVVKKLSGIFSSKVFFVAKKTQSRQVEGVPVVLESDLPEIQNPKELKKVIEEKEE